MKKRSLILAGLMSVLFFPAVVNAAEVTVCADGCTYTTLTDAITNAADGDTIKLNEDLTVNDAVVVNKGVTIDLNGNDIIANDYSTNQGYVLIFNAANKEFKLTDSSKEAGSIVNEHQRGVKVEDGTLTIENITITATTRTVQVNPMEADDVAKVVLESGAVNATAVGTGTRTIMLWGNGEAGSALFEMNGGEVSSPISATASSAISVGGSAASGGTEAVINDGKITGFNGVRLYGTGEDMTVFTMNGGTIEAVNAGVLQSDEAAALNTTIKVYGGVIIASADREGAGEFTGDSVAIYHPHAGVLVIGREDGTGPTLTGETTVSVKNGDVTVQGGTLTATGEYHETVVGRDNGTDDTGAALSITSSDNYGNVSLKVTGGTFNSTNGNALYEGIVDGSTITKSKVTSMSVTGGTFSSKEDSVSATYAEKFITSGTFSSDVTEYVSDEVELSQDENGNFVVGSEENLGDSDKEETPTTPSEDDTTTPEEVPEVPQTYDGVVVSALAGAGALAVVVAAIVLAKKRILFN